MSSAAAAGAAPSSSSAYSAFSASADQKPDIKPDVKPHLPPSLHGHNRPASAGFVGSGAGAASGAASGAARPSGFAPGASARPSTGAAASSRPAVPPAGVARFAKFASVTIHGLQSAGALKYNFAKGMVLEYDPANGRYMTRIVEGALQGREACRAPGVPDEPLARLKRIGRAAMATASDPALREEGEEGRGGLAEEGGGGREEASLAMLTRAGCSSLSLRTEGRDKKAGQAPHGRLGVLGWGRRPRIGAARWRSHGQGLAACRRCIVERTCGDVEAGSLTL